MAVFNLWFYEIRFGVIREILAVFFGCNEVVGFFLWGVVVLKSELNKI